MGNTYVIEIWKASDDEPNPAYEYVEVWRGDSRADALKEMDRYAAIGIKCIKLEYRP